MGGSREEDRLEIQEGGSGAGFKVGKVKLHFEVHDLAFSIISCCPQQA